MMPSLLTHLSKEFVAQTQRGAFLENSIFMMLAGCSHGTPRAKQSHVPTQPSHLTDVSPPRDEQYRHHTLFGYNFHLTPRVNKPLFSPEVIGHV